MFHKIEDQPRFDFRYTFEIDIDPDNRWVKLSKTIQWDAIEERYAENFKSDRGPRAKPVRMALGALIIQQKLCLTDVETVEQIKENPFLQYFVGLTEYQSEQVFDPSLMVRFRKRFTAEILAEINEEYILGDNNDDDHPPKGTKPTKKESEMDPFETYPMNKGKLILDATCAPADIRYPMDVSLLNEARESLDEIIDVLHAATGKQGKRPRTYRKVARKAFLSAIRNKKPKKKASRKAVGKQLRFVKRNLNAVAELLQKAGGSFKLSRKHREKLETIHKLYEQQNHMYQNKVNHVDNRIVSISQSHVRPIVRGKAGVAVEFGAKVAISLVDGYAHIEKLSWEAFNEGITLMDAVEQYRRRYGCYPEVVQADKIYRNRANIRYCEERGIRLSGPRLGRPAADKSILREHRLAERQDNRERNAVEGKFGEGKRRYSLDLTKTRLPETSECVIWLQFLVMNMEHKLRILLLIFLRRFFQGNLGRTA
jgi:hypothetical protein